MNLESLISELLLRHNCVIIPSFGGFVAGQVPAHFDTDKGVILPPRKSLLFNKQLISNDGLLIATYAKHNHLNYDVAEFFIRDTVKKWHDKLAKGERVSIENVGFLYLDAEKNIGFEQDRYSNLLLASYGLGNVHFIPETDIQFVVNEKTSITPENIEEFIDKDTNHEPSIEINNHIYNVFRQPNYIQNYTNSKGYIFYQGLYKGDNSFTINKVIPNFEQPLRMFNTMEISINPSLPLNDILSFVKKIKEDYDTDESLKSFFDLVSEDFNSIDQNTTIDKKISFNE